MIFNPLFINDTAGAENKAPVKNKLSGSNYLFSDIINVYMSEDKTPASEGLKNSNIPVTTGKTEKINVMQILESNKIDLKKLLSDLKGNGKNGLESLLGESKTSAELTLNEKELDELIEGITEALPLALLMNLNTEGLSKSEVKGLIASEIKSEILKNNSIVLNTTEGKIALEVSGLDKGKQSKPNAEIKSSGLVLTEEGKLVNKIKAQSPELSSVKAKVLPENLSNNLKADAVKPELLKTVSTQDLPEELGKEIKVKLQKMEANILPKEKAANTAATGKILNNDIPVDNKAGVKLNLESSLSKTEPSPDKTGSSAVKVESSVTKEAAEGKENSVQSSAGEDKITAGEKTKEDRFFSEVKRDIKTARIIDEAQNTGFRKEKALNDTTENVLANEDKKLAGKSDKAVNESEGKPSAEKVVSEEKILVKNVEEKQSAVKNENLNDKAANEPKVVDDKKVSDGSAKTAPKDKPVQEVGVASGESDGKKEDSQSSDQKSSGFAEALNQADKKVSEKSDFQIPQTGEKERTVKAPDIIKEISRFIQKSEKSSITLNIEPEQLGKVKIALEVADNIISARIEVENEAVKHIVENKINELYSNLSQNGVQLSSVNVSLSQAENKNFKPYSRKEKGIFEGRRRK